MAKPVAEQTGADARFRARDGLAIVGGVALAGVVLAVILLVMGLWKRLARETIPGLMELPSGSWAIGVVLGLITVLGATGGLRSASMAAGTSRLSRASRTAATAVCCAVAFGPLLYLLTALPGKNCRSANCAYIPGAGTVFLAYAVSVGVVGWLLYRWSRGRADVRAARERGRMRRLR